MDFGAGRLEFDPGLADRQEFEPGASSMPDNYYCTELDIDNCSDPQHWDFTQSPSSPENAFRETCEFYGGPFLTREWLASTNEFPSTEDSCTRSPRPKHKAITRSKSLHNFEKSNTQEVDNISTIGLSEEDLKRARSVVGLPTKGYFKDFLSRAIYRGSGQSCVARPGSSELDLGYASQSERLNVSRR